MKVGMRQAVMRGVTVALLGIVLSGCALFPPPSSQTDNRLYVAPMSARHAVMLDGRDVVAIMRSVKFNDFQIRELGASLRNALASGGAAQIRQGDLIEAVFVVHQDDYIHITRRGRGYYRYDVLNHKFGVREKSPGQNPPVAQPAYPQPPAYGY